MTMAAISQGASLNFPGSASQNILGKRPKPNFEATQIPESAHARYRPGAPMESRPNPSAVLIVATLSHDLGSGLVGLKFYEVVILQYSASSTKTVTLTLQERIDSKPNHTNSFCQEHKLKAGQLADGLISFRHANIINLLNILEDDGFVHIKCELMDVNLAETNHANWGRSPMNIFRRDQGASGH